MDTNDTKTTIFYCSHHGDDAIKRRLQEHIGKNGITSKDYGDVLAGDKRVEAIDNLLESSNIVLLLISASFLNDELKDIDAALEKHPKRDIHIIPIILRHCSWEDENYIFAGKSLKEWKVLPTDHTSLMRTGSSLYEQDERLASVAKEVHRVVREINKLSEKNRYMQNASRDYKEGKYDRALELYKTALGCFPDKSFANRVSVEKEKASIHTHIGDIYRKQKKRSEAYAAYEEANSAYDKVEVKDIDLYKTKYMLCYSYLRLYQEALEACKEAINLAPEDVQLLIDKGDILQQLHEYKDASKAYEAALKIDPNCSSSPYLHEYIGDNLFKNGFYKQALDSYELATTDYEHLYIQNLKFVDRIAQKQAEAGQKQIEATKARTKELGNRSRQL